MESEHFEHFSEVEEETATKSVSTPIWRLMVSLMGGIFILLLIGGMVCVSRTIPPSLFNMLSNTDSAPFAITSVNMLQMAHLIMSLALYYRAKHRAWIWGSVQLALAFATHGAFLLVLFLLPFVGWSRDWAR